MSSKLITVENLTSGYDGKSVIENASFSILDDDFIGVIGPNGGGKTTLIKTILNQISPFSGKISYCSALLGEDERPRIGYLPQINSIDTKFPISALDVILTGLVSKSNIRGRVKREDIERAKELCSSLEISKSINRSIGELSGGQMQRVFLCRALINSPRLLILDEPTTYTDSSFNTALYDMLHLLNEKMAILMVSHDIGTVASHIKSIICVNRSVHHHPDNTVTEGMLQRYNCPIQLISHGDIPHTVLKRH